jgi:hypothetical protein
VPAKPSWIRKIGTIRASLERLSTPVLDRGAIELLFGLRRRQAVRLAHSLGARRVGGALVIERSRVLAFLSGRPVRLEATGEEARRQHLRDAIAEAKRELVAQRVRIAVAPKTIERSIAALPATIKLTPGTLQLTFSDAQDLLQQLFLLSQTIGQDYRAFEVLAGGTESQGR